MTSHRLGWPLAGLLFFGCSETGESTGSQPEPDGSDERLCPTCEVRAGGETGSFGRAPCDVQREPIAEDDDALGFTAASVRPLLDREIETSLRWHDIGGDPIPGLEEIVPLTLRVQSGDAFRVRSTPKDGVDTETCRDSLEIDAEVTIEAGDDSIAGRFEAVRIEAYSPDYASGAGEADLSTFRGSLDLQLDPDRGAHMAVLEAGLAFYPDAIRGGFGVYLFYEDERRGWAPGGMPLSGKFPADGCSAEARPVEAAETVGEGPFSDVIDAVRARVNQQNPIAADWDGSAVELTFELGETRDYCLGIMTQVLPVPPSYESSADVARDPVFTADFMGEVGVRSSDGRLTMQRTMDVGVYFDPSGEVVQASLSLSGWPVPAEDFEDRFGLANADLQGSPCGLLWLGNIYGQNEKGDFADGQLDVAGSVCDLAIEEPHIPLEYAEWCTQGTCTWPPRPVW